jgi:anti-sigma-K factor RskA
VDIKAYIESGAIESCVLGLASPEEEAVLYSLAAEHAEVKEALDAFAGLVQLQAEENAITPPAAIKQRLLEKLAGEFAQPKAAVVPVNSEIETNGAKVIKTGGFNVWRNVAAAAIILFIVSAGLNVYYYSSYSQVTGKYQALLTERSTLQASNDDYHKALNIIQDSIMHVVRMPGVPGRENNQAIVYWDARTKDVYVYAQTLQQAPQGKQYQLWALVDGQPVDAGVIGDCNTVCKMKNIPRAQAFAITLENAGGSKTPNLQAMYVMGKV